VKRIYIAGPMTGYPELNFPLFHEHAARLRVEGFDVVNPAELCDDIAGQWVECMRRDLTALLTCDTVLALPGWGQSAGATLEVHVATSLGMTLLEAADTVAKRERVMG